MVPAPASMAFSTTSARKSGWVRAASSAENSTSAQRSRAYSMAPVATRTTSAGDMCSLCCRWMGLVARNTCTRLRGAGSSALSTASMSGRLARASAQITGPCTCRATASTAAKSPGEATGKPTSMMSTPREARALATCSLGARFMLAPGACSPSRRVVSKTRTRSVWLMMPPPGLREGKPAPGRGAWRLRRCGPSRGCRRAAAPR